MPNNDDNDYKKDPKKHPAGIGEYESTGPALFDIITGLLPDIEPNFPEKEDLKNYKKPNIPNEIPDEPRPEPKPEQQSSPNSGGSSDSSSSGQSSTGSSSGKSSSDKKSNSSIDTEKLIREIKNIIAKDYSKQKEPDYATAAKITAYLVLAAREKGYGIKIPDQEIDKYNKELESKINELYREYTKGSAAYKEVMDDINKEYMSWLKDKLKKGEIDGKKYKRVGKKTLEKFDSFEHFKKFMEECGYAHPIELIIPELRYQVKKHAKSS